MIKFFEDFPWGLVWLEFGICIGAVLLWEFGKWLIKKINK